MKLLLENEQNNLNWSDFDNIMGLGNLINKLYYDKVISPELKANIIKLNTQAKIIYNKYYDEVYKPEQERKAAEEKERKEKESLKIQLTQSQADLIANVLGQMSDGYWENNRAYEAYWKNIDLNGTNLYIEPRSIIGQAPYKKWNETKIIFNDPSQIKKWFARKAQLVQNADIKDNENGKRLQELKDKQAHYLNGSVNQTYGEIQAAIDSLK